MAIEQFLPNNYFIINNKLKGKQSKLKNQLVFTIKPTMEQVDFFALTNNNQDCKKAKKSANFENQRLVKRTLSNIL